MIKHSEQYRKAIIDDSRRQYVRAVFDLLDPDATITNVFANTESSLSKTEQLIDRGSEETTQKAATLEKNRWLLDGTWDVVTKESLVGQHGWQSDSISGEDGSFIAPYPYAEQTMANVEILQAISLQFSAHEYNGYPVDFLVEVFAGSVLLASKEFTGNNKTRVVYDGFTANFPTKLRLTVKKWSEPNRRVRVVRFLAGLYEEWDGTIIKNVDILTESTFSGLALPYSSCSIEVYNENQRFDPYAPNTIFESIEARQAIPVKLGLRLQDNTIEWVPAGTYYQQSEGWSFQPLTVQLNLIDIIGMLAKRKFVVPGALPNTLGGWIESIMASLGVSFRNKYIVDAEASAITLTSNKETVSGMFCGELLRYACMATNTWPHQDMETGKLRVSLIDRIDGNDITIDNMPAYATMKENDAVADITFELDSGEITFPGTNTESEKSLNIKNPFIHTEDDARKAAVSCLLEYGGRKLFAQSRGNPTSETGDIMAIDTQFNTKVSARLKKQQLKLEQGIMRNVPSEFVQSPYDTVSKNKVVLTGSGDWECPVDGTIKVTIIQGGTGGYGGGGGVMTGYEAPGNETSGGFAGLGGKVFITEISANKGQLFSYSCGAGGRGGSGGKVNQDGNPGSGGEETTFGLFSSASGKRYPSGLMDVQTGAVYAAPGSRIDGRQGSGGKGGEFGYNGYQYEVVADDGHSYIAVARTPTAGERGQTGKEGCVIVEW